PLGFWREVRGTVFQTLRHMFAIPLFAGVVIILLIDYALGHSYLRTGLLGLALFVFFCAIVHRTRKEHRSMDNRRAKLPNLSSKSA
ncbi:MAG TPA: hypothetical protein VI981_02060, partial [Candidatus Paceibacterota bacterium]